MRAAGIVSAVGVGDAMIRGRRCRRLRLGLGLG